MDDMQTFERRVATEVVQGMGPSEPVDDAAIFTAITATQSPKWRFQSMFSATKFVVAGAIVALFGGFLLAGVLTQQPSEELVPAAATDNASMAVSRFEVDGDDTGWLGPVSETDEGILRVEGSVQFGDIWATDPRFRGELVHTYNGFLVDDETEAGDPEISVHTVMVMNDGGRWIGTGTFIMGQWTVVLDGVDGYEGLTAVWVHDTEGGNRGAIFPGDMPSEAVDWCQLAGDDFSAATSRAGDDQIGWVKDSTRRLCPSAEIPE